MSMLFTNIQCLVATKIKLAQFLSREMQTNQDKHNKETNKNPNVKKGYGESVWYKRTQTRNIANTFEVPVTQVLPVHPVEHWHLLGETQDP